MDRITALALLALISVVAAACASTEPQTTAATEVQTTSVPGATEATPDAAPLEGTLTFVYGSFAPQSRWESYFEDFLAANEGLTIEYVPVSLDDGWGAYAQKIATLVASGQDLDVIWVASEGVPLLASNEVLAPLDDFIARDQDDPALQDYLEDVSPRLMEALQWQGGQYLMPFAWNNMVVWYNPTLLDQAGLEPPSDDWTWDDFLGYAQALTTDTDGDGTPDQWGVMVPDGWFTTEPWFLTNGTSLLNDDWTEAQINSPEAIESLQFLYDLVYVDRVSPVPPASQDELFQAGNLAMFFGGRWPLETLRPAGFEDFDIAPFPQNATAGTVIGSDGYGVAASSDNPDAAWALVKHLGSSDVMQALVGVEGASGSIPARRSLATSSDMAPPVNFEVFYESLEYASPVPSGVYYPELSGIFSRHLSELMADEITVDEAAEAMQNEMTDVLADGN